MPTDVISVIGLAFGGLSTVAGGLAAWFSWKAPTRADLAKVENNTADTAKRLVTVESHMSRVEDHLQAQRTLDELQFIVRNIPISFSGSNEWDKPLIIRFLIKDKRATLTEISLTNDNRVSFGNYSVQQVSDHEFEAVIQEGIARNWFNEATTLGHMDIRRALINAHLIFENGHAYKELTVNIENRHTQILGRGFVHTLSVNGSC